MRSQDNNPSLRRPGQSGAARYRAWTLALLLAACGWAAAQPGPPALSSVPSGSSDSGRAQNKPPIPAPVAPKPVPTRPDWSELTPAQQHALRPLAGAWNTISLAQKRKWIALSPNFASLPMGEQARLHSRMSEWVALSPQKRSEARLNFAEARQLPPEVDRNAKWQAYQALSPDQKRQLAADAGVRAPGAATPLRPVPRQRLASVPTNRKHQKDAKIASVPEPLDADSLLLHEPAGAAEQTD